MKLSINYRQAEQGSMLVVSLITAAILGLTLASYLVLTETQTVSIFRSQSWNTSLVLTEAGVEDALQLVNRYAGYMDPNDMPKWTNFVTAEHWDTVAANVYHVHRSLPYQTAQGLWVTNAYDVWVTNLNNAPTIYAIGTVPWTFQYASSRPQTMFATAASSTEALANPRPPIGRNVYVETALDPLFALAMAAITTIDLRGKNITTDSFDSSDPNASSGGLYPYWQMWKTRDKGNVATAGTLQDSLDIGNAKIKGWVKTGPGVNTIEIGPNGSVGSKNYVDSGAKGIQNPPPHSSTDFNVVFPDVTLPETTWLPLTQTNVTINGTNYGYVITQGGDYSISSELEDSVYIAAPTGAVVRIRVTADVELTGNELINIAPTGAQVLMYMEGEHFSLTGNAGINNQTGLANNFYLFGLPSCTSIYFGGNGMFTGGIYAPSAVFTLGGGGSDVWDFVGASVTRSVSMNGHFRFHYDENLGKIGPSKGYVPVNWREV